MASSTSGCGLHQILRSLCLDTEWKYAVFWKLKHHGDRMVLAMEDAYYDNLGQHDLLANHCLGDTIESLNTGHHSHDTLGLSVSKMSYQVYSIGEGIIGQVAVSGKYQWIFADKHVNSYCSMFEFSDSWQSQFAAGIKSIAVVSVVPHGVVQLGSLNKVHEDMKLVSHIRNVFFDIQDSSVGHISSSIKCSMKSSLFKQDFRTKLLVSEVIPSDKAVQKEGPDGLVPEFSHPPMYGDSSFVLPLSINHPREAPEVENKHEGLQLSSAASDSNFEHQNHLGGNLIKNRVGKGETKEWKDLSLEPEIVYVNSPAVGNINLYNAALQAEQYRPGEAYYSKFFSSADSNMFKPSSLSSYPNEVLDIHKSSDINLPNNSKKLGNQIDLVEMDSINASLKFSAGCELYEALGPAFSRKSIYADSQVDNTEARANIEVQEGMSCSQLTFESGSENLLEAVVANVCHSGTEMKSEKSYCRSATSSLTTRNTPEPSSLTKCTINSAGYSINKSSLVEDNKQNYLNSTELCGEMTSKTYCRSAPSSLTTRNTPEPSSLTKCTINSAGYSINKSSLVEDNKQNYLNSTELCGEMSSKTYSTCPSSSEQFERSSEPSKNNKKRARPGENPKPRPRDRQLIQDRIKELRELVPNGAKCSIDSLLERTVKHMVFLQGITKHADKLGKYAEPKMHQKAASMLGSSNYEQGSSWAVEVGSHLKVCSIVVENINKNGQILVELLCDECSHFLEIAEAIRSLGLAILKGITEVHGEKTWMCFLVEGQDRVMHRMDILWSLVQILQSEATS